MIAPTFGQLGAPNPTQTRFGYDVVTDRQRRRRVATVLKSEDDELIASRRKDVTAQSRDLPRNFAIAAWLVRKHLDYVASFSFQSRTGDKKFDREYERFIRRWSTRFGSDVAQRHPLRRQMRLAEARRTLDGDIFTLTLADGRLQWIESDRIRNPTLGGPREIRREDLVHGVLIDRDRGGRALGYCVHRRNTAGGYVFERLVSADNMLQHGYFDRFDQVRGVGPITPAIASLRDTYERFDYALARSKIGQMFALAVFREDNDSPGSTSEEDDGKITVDFGRGPVLLDLGRDDKAEFLSDKTPAAEFNEFSTHMIQATLKALDIPYSFYDEAHTNYSGQRQALLQYEQSAAEKRSDNQELLRELTAWRTSLGVRDGELSLPRGWTVGDLESEWIGRGLPWIDPLKEIKADEIAIQNKLTSRQRILKRQGLDFWEVADELDAEDKRLGNSQTTGEPANADD